MLNDYSQFIDKVLQEKLELTHKCEELSQKSKDNENSFHVLEETKVLKNELEKQLQNLQISNDSLKNDHEELLERYNELKRSMEESIDKSKYQELLDEKEELENRMMKFQEEFEKDQEKITKFDEVGEG